jgi:hypothetical protein
MAGTSKVIFEKETQKRAHAARLPSSGPIPKVPTLRVKRKRLFLYCDSSNTWGASV